MAPSKETILHKIQYYQIVIFKKILHELFIWRLNITCPNIITFGIDASVLDTDDVKKSKGEKQPVRTKKAYVYT